MPIDLSTLRKLESVPASSAARPRGDDDKLVVIVKLKPGSARPAYVSPRSEITKDMFTADIQASTLSKLEKDASVASVAVSSSLPLIR